MTLILLAACFDVTPTSVEDAPWFDGDGDGYEVGEGDCDDTDPLVYPDAVELCDGVDNDCDDTTEPLVLVAWYLDDDGDGYGLEDDVVQSCHAPVGRADVEGDCDDDDASIHPGADETCDGVDNDCDDETDEDPVDGETWYTDDDGDGYGDPATGQSGCKPAGPVTEIADDCDDADAGIHPGAAEVCDGVDNNCDEAIDEGLAGEDWVELDPLEAAVTNGVALATESRIYVLGGAAAGPSAVFETDIYAAEILADGLGPWTIAGAMPTELANYGAALHEDRVYLFAAWRGPVSHFADLLEDGTVGSWVGGSVPSSAGENAGVAVHDDTLYVLGARSDEVSHVPLDDTTGWLSWVDDPPLPRTANANTSTLARDGYLYVSSAQNDADGYHPEIFIGTLDTDGSVLEWETVSAPITPLTMIAVEDQLVLVQDLETSSELLVYAAPFEAGEIGDWTQLPSLPVYVTSSAPVVVETRLYLFGGTTSGEGYVGSTEAWRLDLCPTSE